MKLVLKYVRLSFANLFKPMNQGESGVKSFSAYMLMEQQSTIFLEGHEVTIKELLEQCKTFYKKNLGVNRIPKSGYDNWAVNKADGSMTRNAMINSLTGEYYEGVSEHTVYFSASIKANECKDGRLTIVDQLNKPLTESCGEIYPGCYVNAELELYTREIYCHESESSLLRQLSAKLVSIQKQADGERFIH